MSGVVTAVFGLLNPIACRRPLHLSTFTLDDFSSALRHPFREPKCLLVSEIHSALVNLIGADQSRVFGSTGASTLDSLRAEATEAEGEERDELDEDNDDGGVAQGEGYSAELDALVRRGIGYARRWDRSAKLKSADGRAGWERHVIGAICQVSRASSFAGPTRADLARLCAARRSSHHAKSHSHPRSSL